MGDAIGRPVEGRDAGVCRRFMMSLSHRLAVVESNDGIAEQMNTDLQYSDDTQLARELMVSLVHRQGFDPGDYAQRIRRLFEEEKVVGAGLATCEAAQRLARGTAWQDAGTPAPRAGNGSAMRAAPIGLWLYDDLDALREAACEQSRITHQDPRCQAGAVAVAGAVALALTTAGQTDRAALQKEFLAQLEELVAPVDETTAAGIARLQDWLQMEPDAAKHEVATFGMEDPDAADGSTITPFVTASVLWSLRCFLGSPDDYWWAIEAAVECGGDVDTTAAMAGAMSGARLGGRDMPQQLAQGLTDQGAWGIEELRDLAEALYALKQDRR
jgi:ADP-ribosylglycohydrolase